ncbi:MAG: hypothetical protein ACP5QG_03250 [candidate division WOR-3 bacterium]
MRAFSLLAAHRNQATILLLALGILALSCDMVDREQADYLMWENEGTRWAYRVVEGTFPHDTFYITRISAADTAFGSESADVCLDWEGRREYFSLTGDRVDIMTDFSAYPAGQVVPLEYRFTLFMRYPPVLGNNWNDTSRGRVIYQGDTFAYYHAISGSVDSLLTISVPYQDNLENVYLVRVDEHLCSDEAEFRFHRVFYLGPDIGIVKARLGPDTFRFADSSWVEEHMVLELLDFQK